MAPGGRGRAATMAPHTTAAAAAATAAVAASLLLLTASSPSSRWSSPASSSSSFAAASRIEDYGHFPPSNFLQSSSHPPDFDRAAASALSDGNAQQRSGTDAGGGFGGFSAASDVKGISPADTVSHGRQSMSPTPRTSAATTASDPCNALAGDGPSTVTSADAAFHCFQSFPLRSNVQSATIKALKDVFSLYPYPDLTALSIEPLYPSHFNIFKSLDGLGSAQFQSELMFQRAVSDSLTVSMRDGLISYRPSCFVGVGRFLLPWAISINISSSENDSNAKTDAKVVLKSAIWDHPTVNEDLRTKLAAFWKQQGIADLESWVGWQVSLVDGVDAEAYFQQVADVSPLSRNSKSPSARLNALLPRLTFDPINKSPAIPSPIGQRADDLIYSSSNPFQHHVWNHTDKPFRFSLIPPEGTVVTGGSKILDVPWAFVIGDFNAVARSALEKGSSSFYSTICSDTTAPPSASKESSTPAGANNSPTSRGKRPSAQKDPLSHDDDEWTPHVSAGYGMWNLNARTAEASAFLRGAGSFMGASLTSVHSVHTADDDEEQQVEDPWWNSDDVGGYERRSLDASTLGSPVVDDLGHNTVDRRESKAAATPRQPSIYADFINPPIDWVYARSQSRRLSRLALQSDSAGASNEDEKSPKGESDVELKPSATTLPPPLTAGEMMAFYELDNTTGLWLFSSSTPTVATPQALGSMFGTFSAGLNMLAAKKLQRLIIDVSSNAGGALCSTFALLQYLFPNSTPATHMSFSMPQSPLNVALYSGSFSQQPSVSDQTHFSPQLLTVPPNSNHHVSSVGDLFPQGMRSKSSGTSSSYPNSVPFGYDCSAYVQSVKTYLQPTSSSGWDPQKVAVVSDGLCVGSCAHFVRLLQAAGSRPFVYGGSPSAAASSLAATAGDGASPITFAELTHDASVLASSSSELVPQSLALPLATAGGIPLWATYSGSGDGAAAAGVPTNGASVADDAPWEFQPSHAVPVVAAAGDPLGTVEGRMQIYAAVMGKM
ncbi:hypothetical protein DFJ73DRAFT_800549 [Zopfochytrium polystomum]|nr:hypothetical protein DFJ73DRAFT_800549 [Zopfochytrium polystomum]